ncbi:MAG: phosphatidylcholine/phosphatidylserine synthase [Alphaproteobacteria bacterium]|nr:phosphatidylcholine/phosphatidylserine synthase [Alphaproteobacteria bacterium]
MVEDTDKKMMAAKLKNIPITRLLPNILTILALCTGLTAMRFAFMGNWSNAALAIAIASVFDILDGRVARLLGVTSKFGAELDSLADLINFGVAPSLVLYLWALQGTGSLGWIGVLVYVVCTATRLARFNTMLEDYVAPVWTKRYFTGVPSPAGAGIALLPLFLVIEFGPDYQIPPLVLAFWLIMVGVLMVTRLPTLSIKGHSIAPIWVAPIMAGACLLVAALITDPFLSLSVLTIAYILSLPYGWYCYRRQERLESLR